MSISIEILISIINAILNLVPAVAAALAIWEYRYTRQQWGHPIGYRGKQLIRPC